MPVFGTMASRFNDDGVTALYQALLPRLAALGLKLPRAACRAVDTRHSTHQVPIVPGARVRYLADIADTVRGYKRARASRPRWRARCSSCAPRRACCTAGKPDKPRRRRGRADSLAEQREARWTRRREAAGDVARHAAAYAGDEYVVKIRDKEIRTELTTPRCRATRSARWRCPPTRTTARC
jgi:methylmalonyl-CoA mutase